MQNSDIHLIVDLAESIRNAAPIQKDPEAAQLINQLIGTQPDALYFLVQTVLLQKEALAGQQGNAAGAGAFPAASQAAAPPQPAPEQRGRWGGLFGSRPAGEAEARPAAGGGSFLKTAAAGAAGVAGGVLLAQGVSGLFTPPQDEAGAHAAEDYDSGSDWGMDDV
ncbi:MAG: DUF2076 domain-containing protein [Actinobacteria bacterium]|nr:DUF2076 domain-containing protein [Actinomycetota bacterium]